MARVSSKDSDYASPYVTYNDNDLQTPILQ